MSAAKMAAKDSVSARLAECYVTIENKRYNFMQAINVEATVSKNKSEVPILGQTASGHKAGNWNGTGSATFHYNTTVFRKLLERYKNTGEDIYFDMEIINDDPTSKAGSQTVILVDCNIDGGTLAKFDANGGYLDESWNFTFEDFKIPESFDMLDGMM
jgi:hypothetical protein